MIIFAKQLLANKSFNFIIYNIYLLYLLIIFIDAWNILCNNNGTKIGGIYEENEF